MRLRLVVVLGIVVLPRLVVLVALGSAIRGSLVRLVAGAAAILAAALLAVLAILAACFGLAGPVGAAVLVLLVHGRIPFVGLRLSTTGMARTGGCSAIASGTAAA